MLDLCVWIGWKLQILEEAMSKAQCQLGRWIIMRTTKAAKISVEARYSSQSKIRIITIKKGKRQASSSGVERQKPKPCFSPVYDR